MTLDPATLRLDFPIFANNPGLVFLDSAASSQKPAAVIDGIANYYRSDYANVHRGVYSLSAKSTELYEQARARVAKFLNAKQESEIVFVRGATEGINLVAYAWGGTFLKEGDEVLLTELEHHANIVPWQLLRDRIGFTIVVAPIDATGGLDLAALEKLISSRTKLVGVTQLANATGALVSVEAIAQLAHAKGAKILVDGCQAAPRLAVDVQALDCDFYVFSGHKIYGPTGIGVLYAKKAILDAMPPFQGGGDMILNVTFEKTIYQDPPARFEAGRRIFPARSGSRLPSTMWTALAATPFWSMSRCSPGMGWTAWLVCRAYAWSARGNRGSVFFPLMPRAFIPMI